MGILVVMGRGTASAQRCKVKQWMSARSLMSKVRQRGQDKEGRLQD